MLFFATQMSACELPFETAEKDKWHAEGVGHHKPIIPSSGNHRVKLWVRVG